ncbi:MAG: transposase [Prevotellaceae bacterium]|nr:transposase [Prevotellaceae bacterium]
MVIFNPNIHHRRSIRLKGYDYSQSGLYFITICCQGKICYFGKIETCKMLLNDLGKITQQYWLEIPQHFPHAILHEYIIMPNHIHGIIELTGVGAKNVSPNPNSPKSCNINNDSEAKNVSPLPRGTSQTIGSIIRGFKIGVTKQLGFSIWQRNYYEHIIRNETAYQNISNYIIHNPEKWHGDKFYIE